jgi:CHAT domain-containing protein
MQLPLPRLAFARTEVDRVAALFSGVNNEVLRGDQATRSAVMARILTATHLHFACHASFSASDTLASALLLAGEESLTVADLLSQTGRSEARLAVLAACDTAVYDSLGVPDEVVGLPAAFIQAGIPGVISALWPIDDTAAAQLLLRFYEYHITEGVRAATALHDARRWLRESTAGEMDLALWYQRLYQESGEKDEQALRRLHYYREHRDERPFAHPYYWAAFTFTGASV